MSKVSTRLEDARALDARDPLAAVRNAFVLPEGVIYLDGNSLGPLPKEAQARMNRMLSKEWGQGLISSWGKADWYTLPQRLGDRLGALVGAAHGQVVVTDSISVNLFKLVCAALDMRKGRNVIVSDAANFPSDLYILQGIERLFPNVSLRLIGKNGSFDELLTEEVAAVVLTGVDFRTGKRLDMQSVTRQVQDTGALMIWDLAHSAGAFPVALDACGADFAVGCTYKYLNAGPGAPAFLYVAARHQAAAQTPITGWFGHEDPFAFDANYRPDLSVKQFLCGTPPVLSYAALEASLDIWEQVDMEHVRAKSVALTELFIALVDELDPAYGFDIVTPRAAAERGSQVAISHNNGLAIMRALIDRGVVGDFRAPDILRFGFTPLTLSHENVWQAVRILDDIMQSAAWREVPEERGAGVT